MADTNRKPDWVVKDGENSRTIGAGWTVEDEGICLRLAGKQLVEDDIYIYPFDKSAN